jgi:Asp-tRNA(Asn)/Glu-tRNA(Gln) amidotransferase B subunit
MEKQKLKNEIKELKNLIIHLVLSLFKDKKISEREALDLLAEAVIKNEKDKQEINKNEWRL